MTSTPAEIAAPRRRDPLWAWPLYALLALAIMVVAMPRTSMYARSLLPDMVEGTAWRPYVKRALTPQVVRGVSALLPLHTRAALDSLVSTHPALARRTGWRAPHADWYALTALIHALSLFGFALAFRALAARTFALDGTTASLAGAAALALVPLHFGYQNYVYDFPALALFTCGLLLLTRPGLAAFYLLWPLGVLNKETFVLLMPVFVLREFGRMPRGRLLAHVAAQVGSAAVIWAALGWVFRATPGGALEFHLWRNLGHMPPLRQLVHDAIYWGTWIAALLYWREKRALVLPALAVLAVLVGTTLVFGFMGEYRDFYEAWPLLALLLTHTALRLIRRAPVPLARA